MVFNLILKSMGLLDLAYSNIFHVRGQRSRNHERYIYIYHYIHIKIFINVFYNIILL